MPGWIRAFSTDKARYERSGRCSDWLPGPAPAGKKRVSTEHGQLADLLIRLVKEKPVGLVGGLIVLALLVTGIFADVLAPYGFNEMILADRLSPPSVYHLLGTDNTGRDLLSRLIFGARISMIVGLVGATLHVLVGLLIGATTGFYGGKFDTAVQRVVDGIQCFPSLILYLTVMAVVGQGLIASGVGARHFERRVRLADHQKRGVWHQAQRLRRRRAGARRADQRASWSSTSCRTSWPFSSSSSRLPLAA